MELKLGKVSGVAFAGAGHENAGLCSAGAPVEASIRPR